MTSRESIKGWEEIFILLMEETDDSVYKKAEEIINREQNQKELEKLIEDELPLGVVIGYYILLMIIEAAGDVEKLAILSMAEVSERIDDFWNRYLRKPTRAYTSKNGIPPVDTESLHVTCRFIKVDNLKNIKND